MNTLNASDVRKEWSSIIDSVVRDKPTLIKRTRDRMWLSNVEIMSELLSAYKFTAVKYVEPDYSITLSLNEIDIIENGKDEKDAMKRLAHAIMEYSEEFYNNFSLWSTAPNRKMHIPYVFKALIIDDENLLKETIECQDGKN